MPAKTPTALICSRYNLFTQVGLILQVFSATLKGH